MLFTSTETTKPSRNNLLSEAQEQPSCCELCGAKVDLAKSVVLVRKRQVVGCPDCDWGTTAAVRTGNS